MQAGAVLIEATAALLRRRAANQDAGAAADAVDDLVAPHQRLHVEEVAEPLPEGHAAGRVADGELDVGDAVDRNTHRCLRWSLISAGASSPGREHFRALQPGPGAAAAARSSPRQARVEPRGDREEH